VLVKICGIRRREDAEAAVRAGADLVGFVFVPGTPRAVDPQNADWIKDLLGVETVGVFRDAPLDWIDEVRRRLHLDRVQLHGSEPEDWVRTLGRAVIRRIPAPTGTGDRVRVEGLTAMGALALVDPGAGDGVLCDWSAVGRRLSGLPFGLAGGLEPKTVGRAIREAGPMLVDVSSGVEVSHGVKSAAKIEAFVQAARNASSRHAISFP